METMPSITIRQARIFRETIEHQSISGAARAISRSQTAVTKSLQELERVLGVSLLDRTTRGVTPTRFGQALKTRADLVAAAFEEARLLISPAVLRQTPGLVRFFQMDVSQKWLEAFVAIDKHRNLQTAASSLRISKSAVSANLRKLEDALNLTLFERQPNAMVPSQLGQRLVQFVKLAMNHLRHANDELSDMQGVKRGRVDVGSLPVFRAQVLPSAIAALTQSHGYIDISTWEGAYEDLVSALRCGDIDFLAGALHGNSNDPDLATEVLKEDSLRLVVGADHPLTQRTDLTWDDLLRYRWVLNRPGTPSRELFEKELRGNQLSVPRHAVETSSILVTRGILGASDCIAILSTPQVYQELDLGLLSVLRFDLTLAKRPVGLVTRADGSLSPAARLLIDCIRAALEHVKDYDVS